MSRSTWKVVLPIAVLVAAAGATAALISSRKAPERIERPVLGPLVEVVEVASADVRVEVAGQGEVSPRTRVDLAPQVTGRVVDVHPALVTGGRFKAGATLLTVDPRDYELAVERARAAVAGAETTLERERAEGEAARAEWREVHGADQPPSLLVRSPQIREAEARLAAARADLAAAQLGLERTRLALPFDGLVIEESVDVGQLVTSGQRVATVYGTAAVEIRVPLDDRELAWFEVPTDAQVSADFAGETVRWEGRVERLEGQVDPRSRMVRIVVAVADPFRAGRPPLLPGTFVDVTIAGRELAGVAVIPRHALREGDQVWVVEGGVLDVRDVEVVRRDRTRAYVGSGLEAGELVVTSSLDAVTDGMAVRTESGAGDV
jgi:RND family efflux transporter MFP subunit